MGMRRLGSEGCEIKEEKMRDTFESWMGQNENKVPGTIFSYANAIDQISQHYSNETGENIDIYNINDLYLLREICAKYRKGGEYEDFGELQHGLARAAISAYVRFFESKDFIGNNNIKKENEHYELMPLGNNVEIVIIKKTNQNISVKIIGEEVKG